MKTRFAAYAASIAFAAATTAAAHAATVTNPAQDQVENRITAQLNQQQLQGNGDYGVETYQGIMQRQGMTQEQIAQPPSDDSSLSVIE